MQPAIIAFDKITNHLKTYKQPIDNFKEFIDEISYDIYERFYEDFSDHTSTTSITKDWGTRISHTFVFDDRTLVFGFDNTDTVPELYFIVVAVVKSFDDKDVRIRKASFLFDAEFQTIVEHEQEDPNTI